MDLVRASMAQQTTRHEGDPVLNLFRLNSNKKTENKSRDSVVSSRVASSMGEAKAMAHIYILYISTRQKVTSK